MNDLHKMGLKLLTNEFQCFTDLKSKFGEYSNRAYQILDELRQFGMVQVKRENIYRKDANFKCGVRTYWRLK